MRHPLRSRKYIKTTVAPETIALEKFQILSRFCQYLGAKSVRAEQVERIDERGKSSAKLLLSILDKEIDMGVGDASMWRFARSITHISKFSGAEPDVDAAQALIEQTELINDNTFITLLEMRRAKNLVQSVEQAVNLTSELHLSLEAALSIPFPKELGLIGISADKKSRQINEYILSMIVEF